MEIEVNTYLGYFKVFVLMQNIDPDLSEKRCMLTYSQFKVLIKYAQLKESQFFYTVNLIWTNQFIKHFCYPFN